MSKKDLLTKPFRVTFASLTEATSYQNQGTAKYSIRALIDKNDKQFVDQLTNFVNEVVAESDLPKTTKDKILRQALKNPDSELLLLKDGDLKTDYLGHEGHYFMNLKRHHKLGPVPCYYPSTDPIPMSMIESEIYSGCWVRVSISATIWEKPKPLISLTLLELQKVKDDAPFVRSNFDSIEVDESEDSEDDVEI